MQRLIAFFLLRAFLKSRTLSSQTKLHQVLKLIVRSALAADFNDPFHVTTFSSDKSASYLELFIIVNLDVKSASILDVLILSCLLLLLLSGLRLIA